MIKKVFTTIGKIILWAMTLFYALFAVLMHATNSPVATGLFVAAALLVIPVKPMRYLLRDLLGVKMIVSLLLSVALMIGGAIVFMNEGDPPYRQYAEEVVGDISDELTSEIGEELPAIIDLTDRETEQSTAIPEETQKPELPVIDENSTFSITYLDVGQGDAALVECDGRYMLIDGGTSSNSGKIYSVLKSNGVKRLDYMVASHLHDDHIGGLSGALNYAKADVVLAPATFYDSEPFADFEKYLKKAGAEITVPQAGDRFLLGSAVIDILALNSGEGENDTSIVLNITYGDTKFMFTGDAERAAEDAVANLRKDAKTTVLKVAHHGADTSTSAAFLRAADPAYAVISVGEDNDYGHPTEQVLERLERKGVQLFRTDLQGDVKCTSDGKTVTFSVERNSDINPYVVVTPTPMVTPTPAPQQESYGVDYILNKNTEKFHYPDCDSVKKMKESNKIYFTGTRDEAIMRGYEPCGNCRP